MTSPINAIKKYDQIVAKIFDIFCKDWDPYGMYKYNVASAKYEYEEYLPDVINVLLSDKNPVEVEEAFVQIVADMYHGKPEDVVRFPEVVAKLLQLRTTLKKYFALSQIERSKYSKDDIKRFGQIEDELNSDLEYADK